MLFVTLYCFIQLSSNFLKKINLQGEYDFSEEVLKDSIEFNVPELLELQGGTATIRAKLFVESFYF